MSMERATTVTTVTKEVITLSEEEVSAILRAHFDKPKADIIYEARQGCLDEVTLTTVSTETQYK